MSIKIIDPGPLTTIQDAGRSNFQEHGFQVSGVLDSDACHAANYLVGNTNGEAVLEMTLMGAKIEFLDDAVIALTGADMKPKVNGAPITLYENWLVKKGSILECGFAVSGSRGYLAVSGGLDVPVVLGSRSTNMKVKMGGLDGRALRAGDVIPTGAVSDLDKMPARKLPTVEYKNNITLRVVPGLQEEYFTEEGLNTFYSTEYEVTAESDRMGCKLSGTPVEYKSTVDIISDGIPYGAIQIPSGGQPIIMLSDRQTTGGYAKLGAVISVDMPKLVQMKMGGKVRFERISVKEAQKLYIKREEYYRKLK